MDFKTKFIFYFIKIEKSYFITYLIYTNITNT